MTKKDIAEIIGVIAVIASLLFLGYEIRQSNQIARSTITYELASNISEINQTIWSNPQIAALHVRVRDPGYEPSQSEVEILRAEARRYMNLWGAVEIAYRNGHQTREQLEIMLEDVDAVVRRFPAMNEIWLRELNSYDGLGGFEFHARAIRALDKQRN